MHTHQPVTTAVVLRTLRTRVPSAWLGKALMLGGVIGISAVLIACSGSTDEATDDAAGGAAGREQHSLAAPPAKTPPPAQAPAADPAKQPPPKTPPAKRSGPAKAPS